MAPVVAAWPQLAACAENRGETKRGRERSPTLVAASIFAPCPASAGAASVYALLQVCYLRRILLFLSVNIGKGSGTALRRDGSSLAGVGFSAGADMSHMGETKTGGAFLDSSKTSMRLRFA